MATSDPLFRKSGTSRARLAKKAVRVRLPARIMVSGQPSAGKTQSSIDMARALIDEYADRLPQLGKGKITVIDTEVANGDGMAATSQNFSDGRDFDVVPFSSPYHPLDLVATLDELARTAKESDVIVVDSMTAFWHGEQGILSLVGHNATKSTFNRWNPARDVQTQLYDRLKSMPCHVILACRAKEKNLRIEDTDGSTTITPLGIQPMQDGDMPYEVTMALLLDRRTHAITVDKCNAPLGLQDQTFAADKHGEFIAVYAEWMTTGGALIDADQVAEIMALFEGLPHQTEDDLGLRHPRAEAKRAFRSEFGGAPDTLRADQADAAMAWVRDASAKANVGMSIENLDPGDEVWGSTAAAVPPPVEPAGGEAMVRDGFQIVEISSPDGDLAFRATAPGGANAIGYTVDEAIERCRAKIEPPSAEPVAAPRGAASTDDIDPNFRRGLPGIPTTGQPGRPPGRLLDLVGSTKPRTFSPVKTGAERGADGTCDDDVFDLED